METPQALSIAFLKLAERSVIKYLSRAKLIWGLEILKGFKQEINILEASESEMMNK